MALAKLAPTRPSKGPTCAVCLALATLDETDAAALRGHLANPAWRYTELSEALAGDADTPLDLSADSLARHARGRCQGKEKLR